MYMNGTLISAENTWALWAILTGIAAGSIWLEQKYAWASKVTGCIIALVAAMALSNFKIIPVDAPTYDAVWSYVVPLAIPMLLFNANVNKIKRESGRLLIIFLISGVGTILGGVVAFLLLNNSIPELYKITAMMVGSYTGGSVNFAAMAEMFKTSGEMASAAVVADNLLMALYFFVLIAMPALSFIKKHFLHPLEDEIEKRGVGDATEAASYWKAKPIALKDIGLAVATSFIIVAVSTQLASFFAGIFPKGNLFMDLLNGLLGNRYLVMTTLTMILATYGHKYFESIAGAQEIGTFLIYIFFTVIGVPASIMLIIQKSPLLLVFCAIMVLFNMAVTLIVGKLFKFSIEEMIIASNANIGGPTTAAAMAIAKGWNVLVIPALLVGTLGYVIGNYYGAIIGNLFSVF